MIDAAIDAALPGASGEPNPAVAPRSSFDGGARATVPAQAPSHDEWLVGVIRQRLADRGASF